jgi:DNA-3-methyladenine glycosylase II
MMPSPDWSLGERFLRQRASELRELLERFGPCSLKPRPQEQYFKILITGIVAQHLPPEASLLLTGKLEKILGGDITPQSILQAGEEQLLTTGLSPLKAVYAKEFAQAVSEGTIDFAGFAELSDSQVRKTLLPVRGLGQWTIEMFMLLTLCRPDVLPADDFLLKKSLQQLFKLEKLPKRGEIMRLTAAWSPWRGLAAWYLWQKVD